MARNECTKVWDLAADELVQLDDARGTVLRVTRGTLWITLENDSRDVVLKAGDAFTIDRDGLTLAEAQRATTVCVQPHYRDATRSGAAQHDRMTQVGATLRAWFGVVPAAGKHHAWPYV